MMNGFDQNLPKTTSYWIEGDIFFINNTSFFANIDEGKAMAELLIFAMKDRSTKGIVFDNREATGAWPQEISQIWESDPRYTRVLSKKKMATLTNSTVKSMQLNRLSKNYGLEASSKAFSSDFNDQVKAFLLN